VVIGGVAAGAVYGVSLLSMTPPFPSPPSPSDVSSPHPEYDSC